MKCLFFGVVLWEYFSSRLNAQLTCSELTLSDFGECDVALVEMLTSIRNSVINSAIRPGTICGGTRKLT